VKRLQERVEQLQAQNQRLGDRIVQLEAANERRAAPRAAASKATKPAAKRRGSR
jgi:septal ring factor EnvC (AmiA/AmiB activator)